MILETVPGQPLGMGGRLPASTVSNTCVMEMVISEWKEKISIYVTKDFISPLV